MRWKAVGSDPRLGIRFQLDFLLSVGWLFVVVQCQQNLFIFSIFLQKHLLVDFSLPHRTGRDRKRGRRTAAQHLKMSPWEGPRGKSRLCERGRGTSKAPRPNLMGLSQGKFPGEPRVRRHGRGRSPAAGFAAAGETARAV